MFQYTAQILLEFGSAKTFREPVYLGCSETDSQIHYSVPKYYQCQSVSIITLLNTRNRKGKVRRQ